jgi:UDP-glucose 4-epimerase
VLGETRKKILIVGMAGGQGRLLTRRLRGTAELCGADVAPWKGAPQGVSFHRVDVRKRGFEDVVRRERPDAVVHMGFVRHFRSDARKRHDVNVRGTKRLLDHCRSYGVKQLVVVSSSYVYGASPENPYHLNEDAPLSASRSYPEIRDLVEVDALASAFLWRRSEIDTCVLRPCNVLGRTVRSFASRYLRQSRVPTVLGFDPMMQFIHEDDLTEAIACVLDQEVRGVFNVVGSGEVPVHTAIRETGGRPLPLPEPLLRTTFGKLFEWGIGSYPVGMLDYLKYPVTLDGTLFREATGFRCRYGLREIFETFRR